jgi:HEAT repeat protein
MKKANHDNPVGNSKIRCPKLLMRTAVIVVAALLLRAGFDRPVPLYAEWPQASINQNEAQADLVECLKLDPGARSWIEGQIQSSGLLFALDSIVPRQEKREPAHAGESGLEGAPALNQSVLDALKKFDIQAVERLGPAAFDPLMAVLENQHPDVRPDAVLFLGRLRDLRAFEPLVALLKDPDSLVRTYAAMSLGILGDPRVANPLVAAMSDARQNVRSMAAISLEHLKWQPSTDIQQATYLVAQHKFQDAAKLGPVSTIPLLTVLKDPASSVRREAAEALAKIPWQPKTDLERACYFVALESWPEVARLGPAAVKPLLMGNSENVNAQYANRHMLVQNILRSFGSREMTVRFAETELQRSSEKVKAQNTSRHNFLLETLRSHGSQAVPALIEEIKPTHSELRLPAVRILIQIPADARTVEPLLEALADPDPQVRDAVAAALAHQGDVCAVEPLILALKDRDSKVRSAAARALGELSDVRAVEPLIHALGDPDGWVRYHSAQALGNFGDPRAEAPLMEALKDPDRNVQEAAGFALNLLNTGGSSEQLTVQLSDKDARIRVSAAEALAKMGDVRGVEPAIEAMNHPNDEVRRVAAGIFLFFRDPRAVEPLILRLKDKDSLVRGRAAVGLERQGDARAVEPLIAALKDENGWVRQRAASALGSLGDRRAVEPLRESLTDNRDRVDAFAALALARLLNDSTAIEPLIAALKDSNNLEEYFSIMVALMEIGGPAKERLIALLKDGGPIVRTAVAGYVRLMPDPDFVEPLIEALQDTDLRVVQSAAYCLVLLDDPRAVKPLAEIFKDPNSPLLHAKESPMRPRSKPQMDAASADSSNQFSLMGSLKDSTNPGLQAIAAWLFGRLGDKQAADSLWSSLLASSSYNKHEFALALVRLGDPRGIPPLLETMKETVPAQKDSGLASLSVSLSILRMQKWLEDKVLGVLAGIGMPAFEPLVKTLSDDNAGMRALAAKGLGRLGDRRAVEPLTAALKDKDERVCEAAKEALRQLRAEE